MRPVKSDVGENLMALDFPGVLILVIANTVITIKSSDSFFIIIILLLILSFKSLLIFHK